MPFGIFTEYERFRQRTRGFSAPTLTDPAPEFYAGDFSRLLGAATGQTDAMGRDVARGAVYDPLTFRQLDTCSRRKATRSSLTARGSRDCIAIPPGHGC